MNNQRDRVIKLCRGLNIETHIECEKMGMMFYCVFCFVYFFFIKNIQFYGFLIVNDVTIV